MSDTGTPPVIPADLQPYNSYVQDPKWQRKFSIIWPSVLAFFVLASLPRVIRAIKKRRAFTGVFGVWEDLDGGSTRVYESVGDTPAGGRRKKRWRVENFLSAVGSVAYWSIPGLGLNAAQIVLVIGYLVTVILCMVLQAPLASNSNRPGFMAIAQFPVVFLFATKNSIVSLLLGPGNGYEKLNFIHRWSGRAMFFAALLHGSLWIQNHLVWDLPILGQQKETSGVASLGLLGVIVLSSLRPVRRWFYEVFWIVHILAFVAFVVTICYHTIYASPWIFPPLAFYGADILMRMFKVRIKDALLVPIDNQMTLIHIPHCTSGWTAGQHVRLRVFFSGRIFESHPLTILSAPPEVSCIAPASMPQGITLGARVSGDWTRALNEHAFKEAEEIKDLMIPEKQNTDTEKKVEQDESTTKFPEVPVQVMLDGPYGGCSVDLGDYESVLLFAGGAGATFTIGLLDDIVGRCVRQKRFRGEKTRRIEFAWCVRSFASIEWFSAALMDIATAAASPSSGLDLHISVYVTCLCNPEEIPPIPNCDVTTVRPSIYRVLMDLMTPPACSSSPSSSSSPSPSSPVDKREDEVDADVELDPPSNKLAWIGAGGGLAVCASGPEGLTREAANAVARLKLTKVGWEVGPVGLHTEVFAL
ncbi:hypothetical protein K443DRAFT_392442 [Laccaria amethystina LaAM-08-1]|uniref:FAD-binding FR-type domain-containing protein n=1 Tax=Laccaria amethystina LaAM-08-1 TaxID=1095629 RepID=A0A0C9YH02_9AGAR|nr:hypothetical protein K443DRAFT_392442 [Laccaria amethystina LaAM-08-1]